MKYFLLLIVIVGAYIYYERSTPWNDADLESLVLEKSEELCVTPELLAEYEVTSTQCEEGITANIDYCLAQTEQNYPGEEFTSKAEILEAFKQTLNCIVVNIKK